MVIILVRDFMLRLISSIKEVAVTTLAALLIILLATSSALAQSILTTDIAPQSGTLDDLFIFTVTIEGSQTGSAPLLSGGDDFELQLIGPQTRLSIINGVVNSKISYVYHLTPKRVGRLLTPAVEVDINGDDLAAAAINVEISKAAPPSNADSFTNGARIILKQSAAPTEIYQGEQLVNSLDLYTRVELVEPALDDLSTDGFWQESIIDGDRARRLINGTEYVTVQIAKALYPLRSGILQLPARSLRAKVPNIRTVRQNNGLDPFGNDLFQHLFRQVEYQQLSLVSNEISVQVKPLPAIPAELHRLLSGVPIVGATEIKLEYDPITIKVGESKSITIEVSSAGNLNPLKNITLVAPGGLKIYEERPDTKKERRGDLLIMRRYFRYSLVPLKPGFFRVPAAQLAFFNPASARYEVLKTSEIAFAVQGEALTAGQAADSSHSDTPRSGLIPTLPPVPIGPGLEYEEVTLLESLSEQISTQFALLLLTTVIALGLLIKIGASTKPRAAPLGLSHKDLEQLETLPQLESFLRALVAQRIAGIRQESTNDEIRARITIGVRERELALALRTLFDDIELLRYSSPAKRDGSATATEPGIEELPALKERIRGILSQWHRKG